MTTTYKNVTRKVLKEVEETTRIVVHELPPHEEDPKKVRVIGMSKKDFNSCMNKIISSFWWKETPEGYEFWVDVHNRLRRLGGEFDLEPNKKR